MTPFDQLLAHETPLVELQKIAHELLEEVAFFSYSFNAAGSGSFNTLLDQLYLRFVAISHDGVQLAAFYTDMLAAVTNLTDLVRDLTRRRVHLQPELMSNAFYASAERR